MVPVVCVRVVLVQIVPLETLDLDSYEVVPSYLLPLERRDGGDAHVDRRIDLDSCLMAHQI